MDRNSLKASVEYGRQRKFYSSHGKEYYAVYIGYRQDAFLDYVADMISQLYPKNGSGHWISIPGVIFKIIDQCSGTFSQEHDTIFIHKRKFRKCLRRAIAHSRVRRK